VKSARTESASSPSSARPRLREALGYSTLSVWMNSGGQVPHERVMTSMRLFAERVMPRLG